MKTFKKHMVLIADNEGFTTLCGINEEASEAFIDQDTLVEYGRTDETTCAHCKRIFQQHLEREAKEIQKFEYTELEMNCRGRMGSCGPCEEVNNQ